ncbi:hypothetical protein A1O7_04102 [Cladophialophora yegresii CBS 114405]|uniref:Uncharacterized protein n=1 Tax=Cladophialophora yegresii CBS 114405 TaxID=1182544 RepID=W9WNI4_9EURO|nr:uncharacterized protein A1O7_04102 [Cladophialophora yegresii CBS 114405]EXJ59954.1 hypothetical protein A1O7_04102 [Cladophialophora yegresii CBS 114405]
MLADTGRILETIESHTFPVPVDGGSDKAISLTDYEFLSSYNWVDDDSPVIYVPGAPAVWKSNEPPFKVTKDQGAYFIDQNTARCAAYPAEALFRSLAIMQPDLSMGDFDLVTDRNCLRKLLRFVCADVDQSFRIDVHLQGRVMFLCRWEAELKRIIRGHENFGYGHSFEHATTIFDKALRDSTGHHRVVRYSLGGVRCLVRYEADGCTGTDDAGEGGASAKAADGDTDDLLGALESMTIAPSRAKKATGSVQVLTEGRVVPLSTIIEIKTRASHRRLKIDEVLPQLWFAQTQNLFVGYHTNGEFQEIHKLTMKPEFEPWETQHQTHLKKLVALLSKLRESARSTKGQRCVVIGVSGLTWAPIDVLDDDEHCPSPLYNRTGDVGVDSRWHAESESSPLQHRQGAFPHATKRRKLIPPGVGNAELITVSSPSEDDRSDDVDHPSDAESPAWQSDLEDDFPLAVRRTPKESGRFAHFKSLASAVVRPGPSSKPAFRTNPEDISHGQTVSAPVLPDIFSPSRRKGKRDYIPGGMADLVRSWVLAIPAQESHGDGQSLPEQVLSIAHVMPDSSGRFCIATDENGARWLLPHQQEKAGIGSLSTLRPGARIVVKGQATKWGLNLDSRESSTVTVAAYWEIVSPG